MPLLEYPDSPIFLTIAQARTNLCSRVRLNAVHRRDECSIESIDTVESRRPVSGFPKEKPLYRESKSRERAPNTRLYTRILGSRSTGYPSTRVRLQAVDPSNGKSCQRRRLGNENEKEREERGRSERRTTSNGRKRSSESRRNSGTLRSSRACQ